MMLYKRVTLLSLVLFGAVAVAEAQNPDGYWLYVDGAWKGGFMRHTECDAAAAKQTGKVYECRPVVVAPDPYENARRRAREQVEYELQRENLPWEQMRRGR